MPTYSCPSCNAHLNVDGRLVVSVKNQQGQCGILLLSDELGDYSVSHNPHFHLEPGEKSQFYCPVCKGSLTFKKDNQFVRLFMKDDDGEESTVIFSAVYGQNATYHISEKREKTYGEQLAKFTDPDWYMKDDPD